MSGTLTAAFWIALFVVAVLYTLILRLTVRFLAKGADNGWDNALGYTIVTGLLAVLAGWMIESRSVLLIALVVPMHVVLQTVALRFIYEIRVLRAVSVAAVHALLTSTVVGALTLVAGFIAAIILKQRIIADPIYFIKLLLRLIGIELPFGSG